MKILVGYIPTPEGLAAVDWAIDYAKTMSGSPDGDQHREER